MFFLPYRSLFFSCLRTPVRRRRDLLSLAQSFVLSRVHPTGSVPCRFIALVWPTKHLFDQCSMMNYSISPEFREAGNLINRTMTVRTVPRFRHPRHRPHHLLASVHDDRTLDNQSHPAT